MNAERRRLRAKGVVQGVGFRPFVHRAATRRDLAGYVLNDGEGVLIEVEGETAALDAFECDLYELAPSQAHLDALVVQAVRPRGDRSFSIRASVGGAATTLVPPDL